MLRSAFFTRGIPSEKALQDNPSITQLFRESNDVLKICFTQGWLQAELSGEEPWDLQDRRPKTSLLASWASPFPLLRFPSVKDLCLAVIREFKSQIGSRRASSPLEANYKGEFYKACYTLLGDIYLSSEWSRKEKTGRVDFMVKSQRWQRWAVECVRDGNRLDEHIARFEKGGRYFPWVFSGEVQEHIILDFRKTLPLRVRGMHCRF
ncbi:hypothetical protein V8E54_000111 [Elaphomyces granulatus]